MTFPACGQLGHGLQVTDCPLLHFKNYSLIEFTARRLEVDRGRNLECHEFPLADTTPDLLVLLT